MKKKIALLLAAVMAFTVAPATTIFAGSSNELSRNTLALPKESVLTYGNLGVDYETGLKGAKTSVGDQELKSGKRYDAPTLDMTLNSAGLKNDTFRLKLENAKWAVAVTSPSSSYTPLVVDSGVDFDDNRSFTYDGKVGGGLGNIPYTLKVDPNEATVATVIIDAAYSKGNIISIPLSVYVASEGVSVSVTIEDNNSSITTGTYLIAASTGNSTNNYAVDKGKSGSDRIELSKIIFKENRANTIKDGNFTLDAPSGYRFVNTPDDWDIDTDDSGLKIDLDKYEDVSGGYDDSYKLFIDVTTPTNLVPGYLYIGGIVIEPLHDYDVEDGRELSLNVSSSNDCNISKGSFVVAKANTYGVSFKATGDAKNILSGRVGEEVVSFTFSENEAADWIVGRTTTFTLPEGVKINSIKFEDVGGFTGSLSNKEFKIGDDTKAKKFDGTRYTDDYLTVENNQFTLKGLVREANKKAKFKATLKVNVEPGFVGDITLDVSGNAVSDKHDAILLGVVTSPIEIITTTTDVEIGYQQYKVADITIKETKAGALKTGELRIKAVDPYGYADIPFAAITDAQWSNTGNIRMVLAKNSKEIVFNVTRGSSNDPSEITIKGLQVRIDRNIPWGSYDLVVYGDSVYQNYADDENRYEIVGFDVDGYVFEKYINVVTEGANVSKAKAFSLVIGSTTAIVGEGTYELVGAPYIANDRTMLPLRDFANLLEGTIYWDPVTSTASVVVGTRTVKFVAGDSNFYLFINGAEVAVPMATAPEITNERMYLPVRAMEDAFGCKIAWDGPTQTVSVNPVGSK